MNNNVAAVLAMGAMFGAGDPFEGGRNSDLPKPDDSDFVKQSKAFRAACEPRVFFPQNGRTKVTDTTNGVSRHFPYHLRKRAPGEISGKINRKHAKRMKVRAMKAAGHLRGSNEPFAYNPTD